MRLDGASLVLFSAGVWRHEWPGQVFDCSRGGAGGGWTVRHFYGASEFSAGAVAGGYCVSRETHDVLFSADDVGGGERGFVDCVVFGGTVETVTVVMGELMGKCW